MIILMGVAGSGKSTQGRLLADELGFGWVSTGEILRVLITGKRRQEMLQGKLLSDEEMIRVMDKVMDLVDLRNEFVLDGFPRTQRQLDWLLQQSLQGRFKISAVFHFQASEAVVSQRLLARGRPDDNEAAIKARFSEYRTVTVPLLEHIASQQIPVFSVDASQESKIVHDQIVAHMRQLSGPQL